MTHTELISMSNVKIQMPNEFQILKLKILTLAFVIYLNFEF